MYKIKEKKAFVESGYTNIFSTPFNGPWPNYINLDELCMKLNKI